MDNKNIKLNLDESSELVFNVAIEAPSQSKPKFRFICENHDMSYVFEGKGDVDGNVVVNIPPMKGKLTEGRKSAALEVIIDNKYFSPLELDIDFVQPVSVTVTESVVKRNVSKQKEEVVVKSANLKKLTKQQPSLNEMYEKSKRKRST